MLFYPPFSPPLINEDLPAGPQLVFTLNNRFFRHQACYSLLPAKPGGQADRVVSLCKYKVVGRERAGEREINLVCVTMQCAQGMQYCTVLGIVLYCCHSFHILMLTTF